MHPGAIDAIGDIVGVLLWRSGIISRPRECCGFLRYHFDEGPDQSPSAQSCRGFPYMRTMEGAAPGPHQLNRLAQGGVPPPTR
jgi:hypothetical protein